MSVTTLLRRGCSLLVLLAVSASLAALPRSTRAAEGPTVTAGAVLGVDTVAEGADDWPGNGVCYSSLARGCSLRAAVMEANMLPGDDTIDVPAGTYVLSTAGAAEDMSVTGDLDILSNISFTGAGKASTVIDGNASDTVLQVHLGTTVGISGLTLRNGRGGGYPGAISNDGALTVVDSLLSANSSAANGGAVFNGATLNLNSSEVSANRAGGNGGGIYNRGTLTLNDSKVVGNQSGGDGGGLDNNLGVVTINRGVIADNSASGNGGGVWSDSRLELVEARVDRNRTTGDPSSGGGVYSTGTAVVVRSALVENRTLREGGNIYSRGALTLDASLVSAGQAQLGGGIANLRAATLANVTLSGNIASAGGGLYSNTGAADTVSVGYSTFAANSASVSGGAIYNAGGTLTLRSSIVANSAAGGNCFGIVTSAGHNLDSAAGCALGAAGDRSSVDPLLGPLAANGSRVPGQTHALLAGSPAIEAGDGICPATDQRGTQRPLDGNRDSRAVCDIGAYEVDPLPNKQFLPGAQR